ncbi:MAG: hypothetical protein ACE37F_25280 [Nannocystaceae bacterium]|nr:hypothetical protein [bacterium]
MANESSSRDWNQLLVNTVVSAAVGAAVSHFLRDHFGNKAQAQRDEHQDRQVDTLRQQQAHLERLLASVRPRAPFASPPPPPMHGLPYAPPPQHYGGYHHPPAYAPPFPALPGGSGGYGEER